MPRRALTLDEVIELLVRLRALQPEYGARPVHVLDMQDEDAECSAVDGLVTDVETDCFDGVQGPVTSLLSWPHQDDE